MSTERKEFSERLNVALDYASIPPKGKGRQIQVASLFEISQESARKWLEGKSFPSIKRIFEIATKLCINPQWLLSGQGNMSPSAKIKNLPTEKNKPGWIQVPVLTWSEPHLWDSILSDKKQTNRNWVWAEDDIGENAYALMVETDDMLPRYEPGTCLIIDPDYPPTHKHKVVFLLNGDTRATCKQLILDGKLKYLKPHNPLYPAITLCDDDKYCGSVRQARMKY